MLHDARKSDVSVIGCCPETCCLTEAWVQHVLDKHDVACSSMNQWYSALLDALPRVSAVVRIFAIVLTRLRCFSLLLCRWNC
jgi:hypothetical protein